MKEFSAPITLSKLHVLASALKECNMRMRRNALLGLVIFCAIGGASVNAAQDPEILAQEAASGADGTLIRPQPSIFRTCAIAISISRTVISTASRPKAPICYIRASRSPTNCVM